MSATAGAKTSHSTLRYEDHYSVELGIHSWQLGEAPKKEGLEIYRDKWGEVEWCDPQPSTPPTGEARRTRDDGRILWQAGLGQSDVSVHHLTIY